MSRRPTSFASIAKVPNLTSGLIDTLVAQIESGDLAPGQRLPTEQAIVEATGVSRTVVREALASLRARGLITTRQGLGAFVSETPSAKSFSVSSDDLSSIGDVLHLLELRRSVEVEAAGIAAERRSDEDVGRMRAALERLEVATDAPGAGAEEDFAFHRTILVATGNPYFGQFFDVLGSLIIPRQRLRLTAMSAEAHQRYLRRIGREHEAILAAIEGRDPAAARRSMRAHLSKSHARYASLRDQVEAE